MAKKNFPKKYFLLQVIIFFKSYFFKSNLITQKTAMLIGLPQKEKPGLTGF